MSSNLHQSGVKLLNALSRHADLIMEIYQHGSLAGNEHSQQVIQNLVKLGVLWRPDESSPWRLKNVVRNLLDSSLQEERSRSVDANISAPLASIKTLAMHYREALEHGRFAETEAYLNELSQQVYGLTESLANNVRNMFSRINNEFGYVSSIDAKIRENELAQKQVSELLKQLELIRFDELSEVAGSHRELRHLLVVALQQSFSSVTQELSLVQARLLALLGRFREFRGRTRLLKGLVLHYERNPDFRAENYAALTKVPKLFNQAQAFIQPAAVDVNCVEQEAELQQLVSSLRSVNRVRQHHRPERAAQQIHVEQQSEVVVGEDKMKLAVEEYFCEIIDSGQRLTALDYYKKHALPFDPEAWLYQVIGGYQGLSLEEQDYFAIDTTGHPHPSFTGNYIIEDVELGLR